MIAASDNLGPNQRRVPPEAVGQSWQRWFFCTGDRNPDAWRNRYCDAEALRRLREAEAAADAAPPQKRRSR